ncbi:MAG: alpha/beta hydrolase family protein [Acidimicrobiia bacterium]
MRQFELVLLFAVVFAIAWPAVFGVRPRRGIAAGLLSVAIALQLQVEGFRWQMVPLYAVAAGLAVGDLLFVDRALTWSRRLARGLFGLAGVGLATVLAVVLPVPQLPVPSGPETIGTVTVELVDVEREEIYGETPGGPRRFMAQVWYPAQPSEGIEPLPWSEDWDVVAPAMSRRLGFPSWFLNHTKYTVSNGYPSIPIADGTFPVIIYSHGWTGFRTIAINQVETLVSNGYMVIAIDHTYGAIATKLENGNVIEFDPAALPDEEEVGEEAYAEASSTLVSTYAADIVTVLDTLELGEVGALGAIAASADLTRIGVYGHSTGGGAAIKVCLEDERCDAVLGLDPWVEPFSDRVIKLTATRPALFMRSDEWRGNENDNLLRGIAGRSETLTYWVGVEGAEHNDFVITPLLSPIAAQLGLKGPIPTGRIIPIIDNYLLGFFDVFLLGTGSAALDNVSFEEVSVEVIAP